MIKLLVVLIAVFSFFLVGAADAVAAGCKPPDSYAVPSGDDVYVVEKGDTGWALAEAYHYDPVLWGRIVADNPMLALENWRWPKGRTGGDVVLILCPGEPLSGLQAAGINPASLRSGGTGGPGGANDTGPVFVGAIVEPGYSWLDQFVLGGWGNFLDLLLWLLAGAGVVAILIFIFGAIDGFLTRQRRNAEPTVIPRVPDVRTEPVDPALAGPPFVAPGVLHTPEVIERGMDQAAAHAAYYRTGIVPVPGVSARRISNIERGRYYGMGEMHYLGERPQPLVVAQAEARPGFRALYELPDGTRDHLITDAACMNPVMSGRFMRGFEWIPEPVEERRIAVPAPTPAPATTAVAAPSVQLDTLTRIVPFWVTVRCGPDGTLSSAISGASVIEGGEVVEVVRVALPVRVAIQLDGQGRLGAAALGVAIPETTASASATAAGATASTGATAAA